jgi:hypothetical protein
MNLALFDLDHTLLPLDSDHEWGEFMARIGAVDADSFRKANDEWFAHYQNGTLDPVAYLEFALGNLSRFPRAARRDAPAIHGRSGQACHPAASRGAGEEAPGRRRPGGHRHRHQPLRDQADRFALRRGAPDRRPAGTG